METPKKSLLPYKTITLDNGKQVYKNYSIAPLIVILVLVAMYFAGEMTGFKLKTLLTRGDEFFVILGRMFPPNVKFIHKVIPPLLDTIKMSVLGTIIGAILSIPIALLAARNISHSIIVSSLMKFVLSFIRTMPTLVTALILTYVFGLGTFAGTLAIAIFTFSFVGKQLYEAVEASDLRPYEAMESLGASKVKSFLAAIVPQVLPTFLSVSLYTFEGNVRHAAILGYVGAGGIGILLNENIAWRDYENVGIILLCLLVTVAIIETLSRYLRKKLS